MSAGKRPEHEYIRIPHIMSTFIRHKGRTHQSNIKSRYKNTKSRYNDTKCANKEKEIKLVH